MRPHGSLIFNSSVVGLTSDPGICGYATSKHALVGLMRTAAKEAARGIRVNIDPPRPGRATPSSSGSRPATGEERARPRIFEQMIPLGRHATPEEIARAVLFLAGGEARSSPARRSPSTAG